MKIRHLLFIAAAVTFAACSKPEEPVVEPEDSISVQPTVLNFDGKAGSADVTVTAAGSWSASGVPSWMTLSPASGTGNAKVSVAVQAGADKARSAEITFKSGSKSQALTVNQEAAPVTPPEPTPTITGNVTSVELEADQTEATFKITVSDLKGKWTVTPKATYDWVSDYTKEGTASGDIVVKVTANTVPEARTAEFTVASEGATSVTLTLAQKAGTPPPADGIRTADEFLAWMADPGKETTKLAADIDMSGKTINPIAVFEGTLDGQGHAIKNWSNNGLYLMQVNKGTVQNLVIDASCTLTIVPGITGFIAADNEGTIDGCINNANAVCSTNLSDVTYFGAIAGHSSGLVKNCVNNGNIVFETSNGSQPNNCIGGVVGQFENEAGAVAIENCTNNGEVKFSTAGTPKNMYIGGVVGGSFINKKNGNAANGLKDYGIVKGCTNTGAVSHIWAANGTGSYCNVGGVAGYIEGAIEGCTNKGTVTLQDAVDFATVSTRPAAGGVVGYVTKSAKNCTNEGTLIVKGNWSAGTEGAAGAAGMHQPIFGGVIGGAGELYLATSEGIVSGCVNKGKLDLKVGQKNAGKTNAGGGGVVGYCSVPIENCHNQGELNIGLWHNIARVGGVVGWFYGTSIKGSTNTGALTFDCNSAAIGADYTNNYSYQDYVAGIVGAALVSATITDCENSGTVTYKSGLTDKVLNYIGGIMGTYSGTQTMTGCKNKGKVVIDSAEAMCVGSLCGAFNGVMTGCEATGDVEVKKCKGIEGKEPEIGALVGYANASFVDCTATNKVTVEAGGASFFGGVAGGFGKDVIKQWSGCKINTTLTTSGTVTTAKLLGRFRNAPSDGTVIYYKDMTFGGNIGSLELVGLANGGSVVEGTMPPAE